VRASAGGLISDGDTTTGEHQTDDRQKKEDFIFHPEFVPLGAGRLKIKSPPVGRLADFRNSPAIFHFPQLFSAASWS